MATDSGMTSPGQPAGRDLVLTRVLDAPRELVWRAWTDARQLAQWWGPQGFTNPRCELDVRPGGAIHIDMRGPDGTVYPMAGNYTEVVPPERLAFTSSPLDGEGRPLFEILSTVTLDEQDGATKVTVEARVLSRTEAATPYLAGLEPGWDATLDRLADFVTVG